MFFDEAVHTDVVVAFYRAMQQALPEDRVEPLFVKCVQQYGEERGRRMAMYAMRAGYPLNYNAYRACGEWESTRPELGRSAPGDPVEGAFHTLNFHCLWCEEFKRRGAADVGRIYCLQIDRSIMRGFDPNMVFELRSYLHTSDRCDFVFGPFDSSMELPRVKSCVKDFLYHTAHMYHSFAHTVRQCCTEADNVIAAADSTLAGWHGDAFADGMDRYSYRDFTGIE